MLDRVLRDTIEPLEQNIVLMGQLYPVVLILSIFIAMGLTLLLLISALREMVMMRVTGMSRLRIIAMLFVETFLIILPGSGIGALVAHCSFGYVNLTALFAYLMGGALAVLVFVAFFVRLKPMELLQVKE